MEKLKLKRERNCNVEMLRIVAMVMVVLLHVLGKGIDTFWGGGGMSRFHFLITYIGL